MHQIYMYRVEIVMAMHARGKHVASLEHDALTDPARGKAISSSLYAG
jgi:hypothetical protein